MRRLSWHALPGFAPIAALLLAALPLPACGDGDGAGADAGRTLDASKGRLDGKRLPDRRLGDGPRRDMGPSSDSLTADRTLTKDQRRDKPSPDLKLDKTSPTDKLVKPDAVTLVDNTSPPKTWYWQGERAADRTSLGQAFALAGYTVPSGTYLLAARIEKGLGQPAFQYHSRGDDAFTFSQGLYWPASTVKLMAAVGALRTLGTYQLSGAASLSFSDDDGAFSGTVKSLLNLAIIQSDNVAYNRLMEVAGFDPMNDQYLVASDSLPQMVLQRRYTKPLPTSNLRTSPPMTYSEGTLAGTIPKRVGVGVHPTCPNEGNCLTLFELLDILRRVALHSELPVADRFALKSADVTTVQDALKAAPDFFEPGASQALGHAVVVYNKSGQVYGNDRLDHGLIVDTVTGERFLVAWSMPYNTTTQAMGAELTRQTLLALKGTALSSPFLQRDAGIPIKVSCLDKGVVTPGTRRYSFTVDAPGADSLSLFVDRWPLAKPAGPNPYFQLTHDFTTFGERLLIVRAYQKGQIIGHRQALITLAP